ncbi:hypothetical protein [Streptomyces sp. NPDC060205]|uniref:hypothetical protein n=1 Tax=Streptomyces sp. NPDC060205 TaxID=3347072 RepID=UPI003648BF46
MLEAGWRSEFCASRRVAAPRPMLAVLATLTVAAATAAAAEDLRRRLPGPLVFQP